MTDKQINAAIAEVCGWTEIRENLVGKAPGETANRVMFLPNYCGCLNAIHEAEKTLTKAQTDEYIALLFDSTYEATLATARQRAEAFLRTLGKWEEATDKESLTVEPTAEESSVDHLRDTTKLMGSKQP